MSSRATGLCSSTHRAVGRGRRATAGGRLPALVAVICCVLTSSTGWAMGLPEPPGAHAVGTAIYFVNDAERRSPVVEAGGRPLTVQIWYPARARSHSVPAPYVPSWESLAALLEEGYYEQDADRILDWAGLTTGSSVNRLPLETESGLPLVVLAPGLGIVRWSYTVLAEALASFGYVVAAVDHPFGAVTRDAAGRILRLSEDAGFTDDEETNRVYEHEWALDLQFVVDWLSDGRSPIGALLDLDRIAAIGHSLGGGAAFEACRIDSRFGACASLDGFSFGRTREEGMGAPALLVKAQPDYSDEDLARRGRTREEWDAMVERVRPQLLQPLQRNGGAAAYYVAIRGTGHMSFSDAPYVMPDTITRFGGNVLSAERTYLLLTEVLRAFLDKHLGGPPSELREVSRRFPEVEVEKIGAD